MTLRRLALAAVLPLLWGAVVRPADAALSLDVHRPELYLPPGGAALVEVTLTNTGTTNLFLAGGSSNVPAEYAADDQLEFMETLLPHLLTPGEVWQGPLLQLRMDGPLPVTRQTFGVTLLGGSFSRSADILATGYFVLDDSTTVSGAGPGNPPPEMLLSARPNPFSAATTLMFTLEEPATVDVAAYSVQGRLVRHLGTWSLGPGAQEIACNGRDDLGRAVQSGIYFLRVTTGERRLKTTVVVVR